MAQQQICGLESFKLIKIALFEDEGIVDDHSA